MRRFILCSVLILTSIIQIKPVSACSGGSPFYIQWLDEKDIVVHATVLQVDDRGYNAILQIDEYFKGDGGKYLAVVRWLPALETVSVVRGYDTSCTYSGGGTEWVVGSQGYFALSNTQNGTYTDSASSYSGAPHFFVIDGRIDFYSFDSETDGTSELRSLPVDEFESLLLDYGHRNTPLVPDAANSAYPLMRFLNITTENGSRYQLNPDRSILQLMDAPLAISSDGSHVAFKLDEKRVGFQYLALERKSEEIIRDGGWLIPQVGRSVMFSPDSNFAIVWDDTQLTIYMFDNYESSGYGQRMTMQALATTDLSWSNLDEQPTVTWSADSTTIAFEDERGIWHWDFFEKLLPKLLLNNDEKNDMPLRDISAAGRYIRFGSANIWNLLDIQTGEQLGNAIATPNEDNLIFIRAEHPETTPDINRQGDRDCYLPLDRSCPIYIQQSNIMEMFWYKNNQIALLSCFEEHCYVGSYSWQLAISNAHGYEDHLEYQIPLVNAIAYDSWNDQPVVAVNGYSLEFGLYPNSLRDEPSDFPYDIDSVDLSGVLDSPIIDLEWGLPIFYVRNQQEHLQTNADFR